MYGGQARYAALRPCRVISSNQRSRLLLLVWAVFVILAGPATLCHARKLRKGQVSGPRPCPCVRPDATSTSSHMAATWPAEVSLASGVDSHAVRNVINSGLELSHSAVNASSNGSSPGNDVFPPGIFNDGDLCKDILQMLPYSWNSSTASKQETPSSTKKHASRPGGKSPGQVLAEKISAGCHHTCAVVGSSDRLIGAHHGPDIDRADIIIRLNAAPVRGYEVDIGARTTLRLVFPKSLAIYIASMTKKASRNEATDNSGRRQQVESPPELYVMRCNRWCRIMFEEYLSKGVPAPRSVLKRNHIGREYPREVADRLVVVAAESIAKVTDGMFHNKPTTGSMAVALALLVCERVSLYGFGQAGDTWYGHYYETGHARPRNNSLPGAHDPAPQGASERVGTPLGSGAGEAVPEPGDYASALLAAGGFKHDFMEEWRTWKMMHDAGLLINVP